MPQRSNIQFEEFEEASIFKKEANEAQGCQNLKYNVGKVTTRMGNEVYRVKRFQAEPEGLERYKKCKRILCSTRI